MAARSTTQDASEVLENDAGGGETDLDAGFGLGIPSGEGFDVLLKHAAIVLGAEEVLEQDAQAVGKSAKVGADGVEVVIGVRLVANGKCRSRVKGVKGSHGFTSPRTSMAQISPRPVGAPTDLSAENDPLRLPVEGLDHSPRLGLELRSL